MIERINELPGVSYTGTNPNQKGITPMTYHLSKAPPPNTINLVFRISTNEFVEGEGTQTFSPQHWHIANLRCPKDKIPLFVLTAFPDLFDY
jgi:hypothetical protein